MSNHDLENIRKEINSLNGKITILKEEYTNDLNEVNYYFWPIVAKEDKKYKNLKWYFTLACCFLFSVIFLILIFDIKNEYFIGGVVGFALLIFALTLFFMLKSKKKKKIIDVEWKKELKPSNEKKDLLSKLEKEACEKMSNYLKIDNNVSYEELLQIYYEINED